MGLRAGLRGVLARFVLLGGALVALAVVVLPEALLRFPRERPALFALVLVAYPWLSVLPQAITWRAFFLERYAPAFGRGWAAALSSAASFALAHLVFHNAWAVALTFAGGLVFARTWQRHRSLALSVMEHALYGTLVFTVGFGRFVHTGAGG